MPLALSVEKSAKLSWNHRKLPSFSANIPREARDLISKIRSCTVRSDLKNKQKTAENALFLRSDLTVQDRILEIRSVASLGSANLPMILHCPVIDFGMPQAGGFRENNGSKPEDSS